MNFILYRVQRRLVTLVQPHDYENFDAGISAMSDREALEIWKREL